MIVKFFEVGRQKASWEAETEYLCYDWLYKQVKRHLLSSDIEFIVDNDGVSGHIDAGFRTVGRFVLSEPIIANVTDAYGVIDAYCGTSAIGGRG